MGRKQQTWEAKDSLQRWRKGAAGAGLFYALVLFLSAAPGRPEEPPATKPSPGTKEEPESSAKQNQPTLQELLSSPPWIKEILFRRSGNYTKISFGGESFVPYPGMLGYKGALQPSGFHLRHLANSATYLDEITPEKEPVFKNPKKGLEFIVGESKEHYWTLSEGHADLAFSYKDPKLGGDPRNSRQMIAGWKRKILIEVRRFGLEHMGRCDLKWTGRDQFSGVSEKLGAISGKIVARDDRERPTQLHYWPDGNLDGVVKVKYSYHALGTIPRMFTIQGADEGEPSKVLTNFIEHIEMGIDGSHPQGYKPTDFRKNFGPLKSLIIESNNLDYRIYQGGHWKKIDRSQPSLDDLRDPGDSPSYRWSLIIFGIFCLSAVVIVGMRWRSKNTNT